MAVTMIDERLVERLKLVPPEDVQPPRHDAPEPPAKPAFPAKEFMASALGVLTGIAAILSVRLILLLAGVGAFVLAFLTVQERSGWSLGAMGIYDLLVFLPVVLLARVKG